MNVRQAHNLKSVFSILAILFLVVLLFPSKTTAVAPANVITYQGRILDTNGVPVSDASVDMVFKIYDSLSGGSCLWSNSSATCATSTARTITLSDGLFSEDLGDTTVASPYAAISNSVFTDDADSAIYLEIIIEGETLSPRKRLTAAPYAVNAQTLDGLDSSVLQLFEVGTNGTFEDDAAVIIGSDAAFTHGSGAAGDLRVADELEVIGNSYFDGSLAAVGQISLGDNGDTFSVDSLEFDVSSSTGSITINDGADAGQISIEGTILDINSLDFVGAGTITSATNTNLSLSAAGSGYIAALVDSDSAFVLDSSADSDVDISTATNERLVIKPNGTGDTFFPLDNDSVFQFNLQGTTGTLTFVNLGYTAAATLGTGASTTGLAVDLSTNVSLDGAGNDQVGLLISTTNGGAGTTKGIEIGGSPDYDLELSNNERIYNSTNGSIHFYGSGGGNDTGIYFDLDGAVSAVPTILSANNDLININDGLSVGVDGSTTKEIANDGFVIAGGNDLYVTDMLGVNGASYFDDSVSVTGELTISQSGTSPALYINSTNTSGSILSLETTITTGMLMTGVFSAATELSNDLRGLNLDLANNVSYPANINGIDTTGIRLALPGVAETTGGTASIYGLNLTSDSLSTTSGGIYWIGSNITVPGITQTGGTIEATGYNVSTSSITTGGTEYGIRIQSSGIDAGNLYGLSINNITGSTGTEKAIQVGTGWDMGISTYSGLAFGSQTSISGATPSVDGGASFVLTQTGGTTVTDFTHSFSGQLIFVEIGDANTTFDCTANPNFNCGTGDITAASGDISIWLSDSSGWNLLSYMDASDNQNTGDGFDLAEYFQSSDTLLTGEVVTIDPATSAFVSRSTGETYDNMIVGVVSTDPGEILGDSSLPNAYPIALAGRVPVNVTNENGVIFAGDPLTTSSTPGYAMKATKAGKIVSYALEDFTDVSGQVLSFVQAEWSGNESIGTDGVSTTVSDTLVMTSLGTADVGTTGIASQIFALRGSGWNGTAAEVLDMKIQTEADSSSSYRLSIKNTVDTEVAYITNEGTLRLAGNLIIAGNIYPSDRGTAQTSKYIYYDGSVGPGGDMMRTNAAGWSTGSYDFAEMFPASEPLEAGDVVAFVGEGEKIGKTSTTYNKQIAGIISTRPGFLAGENQSGHFPVALAGRVPTKVNLEGGNIAVGDPLTTSSTPGFAMKATNAGMIVGYALEPYTGGSKKITVFVNSIYFDGTNTNSLPGVSNTASQVSTGRSSNFTSLNMEGGLYMGGNDILNIRRLVGIANLWSIEEDGTIKTEGTIKTVINSYQNEKIETTAVTSSGGVFVTLVGTSELSNGTAVIEFENIDPNFNDVISTTAPINIVATPNGPVSLYVSQKDHNGFTIRQMNGSASGIAVDWIVTAYRKDFEPVEEDTVEETPEEEIVEPEETSSETSTPTAETETTADDQTTQETPAEETTQPEEIVETEAEEEVLPPEVATEEPTVDVAETGNVSPADEPAPSESPTQSSDPTVEGDGGQAEPSSPDVVSTDSSTQTEG